MLFVITFFSLIVMYIFERLNLAYWHPKPPMYEKAMNEQVIMILKWSPIGLMLSLYWLLGNNQMFGNSLSVVEEMHSTQDPMHPLIEFTGGVKADHMVLLLIPVYLLFKIAYNFLQEGKHKWDEDFNLDEKLGTYWESISGSNQKVMYATEVYYRNMFQIQTISDEALENLRKTKNQGFNQVITTIPSYYIFDNKFYQDSLQYVPLNYRDEAIDNQVSDPIAVALFQSDNTRMSKQKQGTLQLMKSDFSDAKEQQRRKTMRMLLKLKGNPELK